MNYEIINQRKKMLGLTNAQIAERTGITLSTLDKITSGANSNPKLDTLQAIAAVIGCTLDDFSDEAKEARLSPAALELAKRYDALDKWGKQAIDALLSVETERCAGQSVEDILDAADAAAESRRITG